MRAIDAAIEAAAQDCLRHWRVSRRTLLRTGLGLLAWPAGRSSGLAENRKEHASFELGHLLYQKNMDLKIVTDITKRVAPFRVNSRVGQNLPFAFFQLL